MARGRRRYVHGTVMFITDRVADGLPFVPHEFMKNIIKGILARAQTKYPVEVCHFVFMGNHYHMLTMCNPDALDSFMEYVNGEIGKCINRLRGVSNRNVWSSRYCAQSVLTVEDIIETIAYIYTNPVKAYLVDKIEDYPGLSSWEMYEKDIATYETKWIRTSYLSKLPYGELNDEKLCSEHLSHIEPDDEEQDCSFTLSPYAWLEYFKDLDIKQARQKVNNRIIELTEEIRAERIRKKKHVVGKRRLLQQGFYKSHRPKTYGRRVVCICWDIDLRDEFNKVYRHFCELCRKAWNRWKVGDYLAEFPPGALKPPVPIVANIWPAP